MDLNSQNCIQDQQLPFWHIPCILSRQEAEMVALRSCEILDELKKLGIELPSDLIEYISEYSEYCSRRDSTPEKVKD